MTDTRIVEIDGVKIEVDLRKAKTISTYKVGDNVRILVKEYETFKSYPGVIVGFDNFKNLPTIIVAYLKVSYSSSELEFAYINKENSKEDNFEIVPNNDKDILFEKGRVIEIMNSEIETKREEVKDLENKKEYFLKNFNKYFNK